MTLLEKKIKTVKLQHKYRTLTGSRSRCVPWITISGVWLEQYGFKPGDTVVITVEQNQLIIKAVNA
jgi:toxic protein SymE